jgi:hypothetical protein
MMNLPVLFRTRWVSQTCRKHKALTFGLRIEAEVMQSPPFNVSLSSSKDKEPCCSSNGWALAGFLGPVAQLVRAHA